MMNPEESFELKVEQIEFSIVGRNRDRDRDRDRDSDRGCDVNSYRADANCSVSAEFEF